MALPSAKCYQVHHATVHPDSEAATERWVDAPVHRTICTINPLGREHVMDHPLGSSINVSTDVTFHYRRRNKQAS